MRSLILAFFSLTLYSITLHAQTPNLCTKHLAVGTSTESNWAPGIVQNNSQPAGGKVYEVQIKIRKNGYITFENLITENEVLPVEIVKDGTRNVAGPFKKGDVLTLIARTDKKKVQPAPENSIALKIKSKNAVGAVSYTFKDKQYIHPLASFIAKENKKLSQ